MHIKKLFNLDFFLNMNLIFTPKNIIPDFQIRDLSELKSVLTHLDVSGLIFDIDQTIVPFNETEVDSAFSLILQELAKNYRCCLLSNFVPSEKRIRRVRAVEKQINIPAVFADKKKPAPEAFQQAMRKLNSPPGKTVMIGDRILTDILGANHLGLITVLVKPIAMKTDPVFLVTIPRLIETVYLKIAKILVA